MDAVSPYDAGTRHIHMLLALLGVAALVSGQFADDYRRALHAGFDVHRWVGLGAAVSVLIRILWGFAGPQAVRFSRWVPLTAARLRLCRDDLVAMARVRLPLRAEHEGLAALIQTIGLAAFAWMGVTGTLMWLTLKPGTRATGWIAAVKELHEGGQVVAIAYVAIHVIAVLVHSLAGHPVWRRMAP
jgi:cytochrome b